MVVKLPPSEKDTPTRPEHLTNAESPITSTFAGIEIRCIVLSINCSANAYSPISVTDEGIPERLHPRTNVFPSPLNTQLFSDLNVPPFATLSVSNDEQPINGLLSISSIEAGNAIEDNPLQYTKESQPIFLTPSLIVTSRKFLQRANAPSIDSTLPGIVTDSSAELSEKAYLTERIFMSVGIKLSAQAAIIS